MHRHAIGEGGEDEAAGVVVAATDLLSAQRMGPKVVAEGPLHAEAEAPRRRPRSWPRDALPARRCASGGCRSQ